MKKRAVVQDDEREMQMREFCKLSDPPKRIGCDALDDFNNEYELKSVTTTGGATTPRNLSFSILEKLRRQYWIFAYGDYFIEGKHKVFSINELYIAHPNSLEWFFELSQNSLNQRKMFSDEIREWYQSKDLTAFEKKELHNMLKHGCTLHARHISLRQIRKYATKIRSTTSEEASKDIRKFVEKNPILVREMKTKKKACLSFLCD